jgi:hypothetical protein
VFNNKKPAFWIVCAAVVVAGVGAVLLTANPQANTTEWRPQPEYEDQDEYWKALAEANASDRTKEIAVDDMGDREKTARAWMEAWLGMYKALPGDNMAHIAEWAIDRLDIIRVPKSGRPEAFVFSATFSVRPTYPIARNSFWMAGNTGESPGRDETWGQMYREIMLRAEDDGKYHFAEMGTGAVGYSENMEELCGAVDILTQDYGTPEMLERYGNKFTAAAMELYKKNLEIRAIGQVSAVYTRKEELGLYRRPKKLSAPCKLGLGGLSGNIFALYEP